MSSEGPPPGLLCARGRPSPPARSPRAPSPPPHADGSLRPQTRRLPRSPRGGAGRAAGGPSAPRLTAAPEGQRPRDRRLNSRPPRPPSNTGTSAPLHLEPGFRFHQSPQLPAGSGRGPAGAKQTRRPSAPHQFPRSGAEQLSPAWQGLGGGVAHVTQVTSCSAEKPGPRGRAGASRVCGGIGPDPALQGGSWQPVAPPFSGQAVWRLLNLCCAEPVNARENLLREERGIQLYLSAVLKPADKAGIVPAP